MKTFQGGSILSAVLLLAEVCTISNAVTIKLSALRPDLEYFRGTWLQNPSNSDVQGRIVISNRSELGVLFERTSASATEACLAEASVQAWTPDTLQLENTNTSVHSLFYKHGAFYIRRYRCDAPEVLDKDSWVELLPIKTENDLKEAIEVRYVTLKTLGKEIEREVNRIDSELTGMEGLIIKSTKSSSLIVHAEDNQFAFDYERGHRFVDVRHVRVIRSPPKSTEDFDAGVLLFKGPQQFVDFAVTRDYDVVRYDRLLKSFSTAWNENLDSRWVVRSNNGNYVMRVGAGSEYRTVCIPPHLCSLKAVSKP